MVTNDLVFILIVSNYLAALFVNPSNTSIQRRKDTMEDELNYLRSEIAKIRMEKEKANGITLG